MPMYYPKAKIYSDGSHFIAIPSSLNPARLKRKACRGKKEQADLTKNIENKELNVKTENEKSAEPTLKDEFERLYKEYSNSTKTERKQKIIAVLLPRFESENAATAFVENNIEREKRNLILRKIRLYRKVWLQKWNYFCTFTYDDEKQTAESFRKSLMNCLRHLANRKSWKYIGVWEMTKSERPHFHCIAYVPEGHMIGTIETHRDYNVNAKRMKETHINSHFLEKFGRNDFVEINPFELQYVVAYLIKYIEKTGERFVYSRNLPTYIVSDILEEDVICTYGVGDRKLILFDNFTCMDEGEIIGKMSPEMINLLPKCN